MMQTERTRSNTPAVTLGDVRDHLRLSYVEEEVNALNLMIEAATYEIEERAGLAIMAQTITVTTDAAADIPLPVGPVAADGIATLATLGDDGTVTPVASGFWLETGRWPTMHITDPTITGRVVITYTAGSGAGQAERHAICDQVGVLYEHRATPAKGMPLSMSAAAFIARRGRVRV
jgi:uncharacterized phiE125 gp8 family phage protein